MEHLAKHNRKIGDRTFECVDAIGGFDESVPTKFMYRMKTSMITVDCFGLKLYKLNPIGLWKAVTHPDLEGEAFGLDYALECASKFLDTYAVEGE